MRYLLLLLLFTVTLQEISSQEITSPDNKLKLTIKLSDTGELVYSLMREGEQVIKDSKLGIDLLDQADLMQGFSITNINNSTFSEEWEPVWGEVDKILNNYNQMQVTLNQQKEKRTIILTFRVFNDGIGFRYEFPKQDNLTYFTVLEENTEFNLTGDHKTFWIPGDYDSQEYTYTTSLLSEVNSNIDIIPCFVRTVWRRRSNRSNSRSCCINDNVRASGNICYRQSSIQSTVSIQIPFVDTCI
ncbi:MAG: glycoside hydrolase family 97 N-terminal domain-containing protein [Ignavibacteriota bacterium]